MTRAELIKELRALLVHMENGERFLLVDPEEYKRLKEQFDIADADVWEFPNDNLQTEV